MTETRRIDNNQIVSMEGTHRSLRSSTSDRGTANPLVNERGTTEPKSSSPTAPRNASNETLPVPTHTLMSELSSAGTLTLDAHNLAAGVVNTLRMEELRLLGALQRAISGQNSAEITKARAERDRIYREWLALIRQWENLPEVERVKRKTELQTRARPLIALVEKAGDAVRAALQPYLTAVLQRSFADFAFQTVFGERGNAFFESMTAIAKGAVSEAVSSALISVGKTGGKKGGLLELSGSITKVTARAFTWELAVSAVVDAIFDAALAKPAIDPSQPYELEINKKGLEEFREVK